MILATAVLGACAKEIDKEEIIRKSGNEITVSIMPVGEESSGVKAVYDGESHIAWQNGDQLAVKASSSQETAEQNVTFSPFNIGANLTDPVFSGAIVAEEGDSKWLYAVYPYSAMYSKVAYDQNAFALTLPGEQTHYQSYFDPKADVMVGMPLEIQVASATTIAARMRFAHLFGFVHLKFDVPDYADQKVLSVKLESASEADTLSGVFKADLNKHVSEGKLEGYTNISNAVELKGDGKTALKDFEAWMVVKPGTFENVVISVTTEDAVISFERKGLSVKRSTIFTQTIHFKEGDKAVSSSLVLDGNYWEHLFTSSATSFSSTTNGKELGPTDSKMMWSILYDNDIEYGMNGAYGTYAGGARLNNNNKMGTITVASEYAYRGIANISISGGLFTASTAASTSTSDFHIDIVNGGERQTLMKKEIESVSVWDGAEFIYEVPDGKTINGKLEIVFDNFKIGDSEKPAFAYLNAIKINNAPEITLSQTAISLKSTEAASGSVSVSTKFAQGAPTVTSDSDWLTATYADGKISYAVAENTAEDARTGIISVTCSGTKESTATLQIKQTGTKVITVGTYKLTVTPADIYAAEVEAKVTNYNVWQDVEFDVKAVNVEDETDSVTVPIRAKQVKVTAASAKYFTMNYSGAGIVPTLPLENIRSISVEHGLSYYSASYFSVSLGLSASSYESKTVAKTNTTSPYVYTYECAEDETTYSYFKLVGASSYTYSSRSYFYGLSVVFTIDPSHLE